VLDYRPQVSTTADRSQNLGILAELILLEPNSISADAYFPIQMPVDGLQGFVPVNCPVCAQVHLVDPKTARVAGADDDERGAA
jgi:hypothetical protein